MSVFNKPLPVKPKIASKHPWKHRIRAEHTNTYKHGHNSVHNPTFVPLKKEKTNEVEKGVKTRVKFIVIGNRVTKEFIYCLHVVTALRTYRKKLFDSPIIRGVTSVEWPKVLTDLKMQYGALAYCLKSQVAVLINGKILGGETELREYLDDRYDYRAPLHLDYFQEGIRQFADYIYSYGRPCVYMHISIDDVPIGPLIFMLYSDIVPLTCQNFIRMCVTKKGGYPGTPIHRIVKDNWIQGGGYGLKSPTKLSCENFIVPHDRRGVLCMANDGRHVDCSTQFFVILESSTWMEHRYVAFGQLIEGEETLKKIESVPTWYESPTSEIIIYKSGVFNMDCQWASINKNTNEFYDLHIEDVSVIKKTYYEELMNKVFVLAELRYYLRNQFVIPMLKKVYALIPEPVVPAPKGSKKTPTDTRGPSTISPISTPNEDFDMEVYEYEIGGEEGGGGEEFLHDEVGETSPQASSEPLPKEIYFWPLTDVPYPGEVESAFDLKRLLKGDYCLEIDLEANRLKEPQILDKAPEDLAVPEDIYEALYNVYADNASEHSVDSEEDQEIKEYLREFADTTSFAGPVIKKITEFSKRFAHLTGEAARRCIYSDEDVRLIRSAVKAAHDDTNKKVIVSSGTKVSKKIPRRPTGYIRAADLARIEAMENDDDADSSNSEDDDRKEKERALIVNAGRVEQRRVSHGNGDPHRKTSTLERLFDDVSIKSDEEGPTLKNYKPLGEIRHDKNYTYLTHSPLAFHSRSQNKLSYRPPIEDYRVTDTLAIQHGKKVSRKISSDYANTISNFERVTEYSIRTIEFARHRPTMTVMEYKMRNRKHQAEMKESKEKLCIKSSIHG